MAKVMEGFARRLQAEMEARQMSKVQLANLVGVSGSSVTYWTQGRSVSGECLLKVSQVLGVRPEWLLYGTGPRRDSSNEYASIPVYRSVALGAGDAEAPSLEECADVLPVRRPTAWFAARGLDPSRVIACKVSGDSMQPTIRDGSIVLVDTSDTEIHDGTIYAFAQGDSLRVKRLGRQGSGGLLIRSDNPGYPPESVPGEIAESSVKVIGRAVGTEADL